MEDRAQMARVLVIDDEPDVLVLCKMNLEMAGHEVIQARDGQTGIDLAREHCPDAVILDLMMARVDGYEVLKALSEQRQAVDVTVVILTAKARQEDRLRCLRDGADEFITKPFSPQDLVTTIEGLLALEPEYRADKRMGNSAAGVSLDF
jgi:Response regulators consisting of a CheY-like receiver domain and a winged-helix DNA-binding domain